MTGRKIKNDSTVKTVDIKHVEKTESDSKNTPIFTGWIATAVLEYADDQKYNTQKRIDTLSAIISELRSRMPKDTQGLVVLPGGWIDTGEKKPENVFSLIEKAVSNQLKGTEITVCLGIDGGLDIDGYSSDQVGLAINNGGIIAAGRKFHPSPQERSHVDLCEDFKAGENGYPRTFAYNGKTGFIAVCYDTYGIRQNNLTNPGVDFVVNLVHCFYPKGLGPSGEQYFAKHGFAGASKQWGCPVFGTAVFYNRGMPERWPTGVMWNSGDISTTKWCYENNPVCPSAQFLIKNGEDNVVVRIF